MTDQEIEKRFRDLQNTVSSLEYMLAQTMTIALQHSEDPAETLVDLQAYFFGKMAHLGFGPGHPSFEAGDRVFSSVKTSTSNG